LDVLGKDPKWYERSKTILDKSLQAGALIINEIVYAELATQFEERFDELNKFLVETQIKLLPSNREVLEETARAWNSYLLRKERGIQCPQCGNRIELFCSNCNYVFETRQHIISDFLIGAHAKILADRLLSRDRGYYKTYFKNLRVLF
jgi:hypothetical protein